MTRLQSEVDALQSGLESIASTFNSDEVVQLCKRWVSESPILFPPQFMLGEKIALESEPLIIWVKVGH